MANEEIRFTDYKALVVVALSGGSDSFNMVAPTDAAYAAYASARGTLALTEAELVPLNHANANTLNPGTFGMRSNMLEMQSLFNSGKLAIMANVGTLKEPITKAEYLAGSVPTPGQLFSHNSQQALWSGGSAFTEPKGWAARMMDVFYPIPNPYGNINASSGDAILQKGGIAEATPFRTAYVSPNTMEFYGFGPSSGGGLLGTYYQNMYEKSLLSTNKIDAVFGQRRMDVLNRQVELQGLFNTKTVFAFDGGIHESGTPIGDQLKTVAETLSVKDLFPGERKRQVFYVSFAAWDSHNSDIEQKADYLSTVLGEFDAAMTTLGLQNEVTVLTVSDFGRSLSSNGPGTDHGWGGHAYVMGGAVNGGDIYGKMPVLATDSIDNAGGRIIPTTAMDQYLSTVAKWMGATDLELDVIFPNLAAFPTNDMGFMESTTAPVERTTDIHTTAIAASGTASSTPTVGGYEAFMAFDGDFVTTSGRLLLENQASEEILTYAFSNVGGVTINSFRYHTYTAGNPTRLPQSFELQVSDGAGGWIIVYTETSGIQTDNIWSPLYNITTPTNGESMRMVITSNWGDAGYTSFGELELNYTEQ